MADRSSWSLVTSVIASVGAAAGCALPLVLVLAGVGGSWLSMLHQLQPFVPVFSLASLASLAYAAWKIFGKPRPSQMEQSCPNGTPVRTRKGVFWVVLVANAGMLVVAFFLVYMV